MLSNTTHTQIATVRTVATIAAFAATFFVVLTSIAFAQGNTGDVDTGGPVVELLAEIVYPIALAIGGLFVGIGGFTLDIAIQQLIIGMGGMWNSTFGLGIIEVWKVIRDLFNILFIFGFIFIGIKTILNSEDSNTRRALGHLIIAAIFINFSLLIAQVVIDFSNVAATQIYNMATSGITVVEVGNATTGSPSITMAFMDTVSLGSFFEAKPDRIKGAQLITYSILMMIFFIIAGIIFLFAAYHVIYRFVALILYMILSPVLFLGFILPNFKAYTDRWVGGLLRQSFFAPAFLFLVYVALLSIDRLKSAFGLEGGEDGFPSIMDGADMTTAGFMIFVFFGIGIGFLYASVKVGDILGISGSKTTMSILGKARGYGQRMIGNATLGAVGAVGRGTVGQIAHRYSESDNLKDAASKRGPGGAMARATLRATRSVGDASFDARRVGGVGKNLGIGEGTKGGFKTQTETIEKKEKEFAKSLGEIDNDDPRVNRFIEEKNTYEGILEQLKIDKENIHNQDLENALLVAQNDVDTLKAQEGTMDPKEHAQKSIAAMSRLNETKQKIKEFERAEKARINSEISAAEKSIKEMDQAIKGEKNRRQVGIDVDPAIVMETQEDYRDNKKKLSKLRENLAEATKNRDDAAIKSIAEEIKHLNKAQKDLARKAKEAVGTLGYAGVLEKRKWWVSAALGRVTFQDREAGKAVRKEYEKAAKKSKEDATIDGIKEAVEKAAKKD